MNNESYFYMHCGLQNTAVELLQKSSVRAKDTNEVLLRLLEGPVTRHLPVNSHIVGGW